jgi:branched-chain amino acid transport system permease protein
MIRFLEKNKTYQIIILLIILSILPFLLSKYSVFIINLMLIYSIVSVGLNLLMGYTGLISIGHAGFFAIGSYITGILTNRVEALPCIIVIIIAGLSAGLIGFFVGIPALRLEGFYLAMATVGFGVVVNEMILQLESLTRGADGLFVKRAFIGSLVFDSDKKLFYLILFFNVSLLILAINLIKTKTGRALMAMRDSEPAAQTVGINLSKYKTVVFSISALYTGIAGSLFSYLVTFISPDVFDITLSINFITMIIVGGMGSIAGSFIGAVILTLFYQLLTALKDFQTLFYGIMLTIFMIFMPEGLVGLISKLRRWKDKLFEKKVY